MFLSNRLKGKEFLFNRSERLNRPQSRWVFSLTLILLILLTLGMANLYSASLGQSYFYRQLRNLIVIVPAFIFCAYFVSIRKVYHYAWWIYFFACLLLFVVVLLGKVAGGAQRWVFIGPFGFQPSEFAKLVTAIITARYFAGQRIMTAYRLRELWPILSIIGILFVLIFVQPDFGTAGMCLLIFLSQIFFVRIDYRSIMLVGVASPVVGALGWILALRPYQKLRILNLFNPELDPQNTGYNSLQSLIAIGSGDLFGKGFMKGTQAHLKFLPERHTDFVFSVLSEEHGLFGGMIVFLLFTLLAYVTLEIARHARDTFSSMLAVGIAAFIFLEFAINIAMVLGLFPVVGLPLPFFSYGSSNLLTVCMALGLLVSINRESLRD